MSANCLFCKMLKGEIPVTKIFENEKVFAIEDIHPQAKIHWLFLHKNHTANISEMSQQPETIADIFKGIAEFTNFNPIHQSGFRVVTNLGPDAGQSVFHTHFHVLGGEELGPFGRRR